MKTTLLLCLFLLGCSPKASRPNFAETSSAIPSVHTTESHPNPPTRDASLERTVLTDGIASHMQLTGGFLQFCDRGGGQKVNLESGERSSDSASCAQQNDQDYTGCKTGRPVIEVSSSSGEANDEVEVDGDVYRIKGRVHDCDNDGKVVLIASGVQVLLIDETRGKVAVLDGHGAEKVSSGSGWLAWRAPGSSSVHLLKEQNALAKAEKQP